MRDREKDAISKPYSWSILLRLPVMVGIWSLLIVFVEGVCLKVRHFGGVVFDGLVQPWPNRPCFLNAYRIASRIISTVHFHFHFHFHFVALFFIIVHHTMSDTQNITHAPSLFLNPSIPCRHAVYCMKTNKGKSTGSMNVHTFVDIVDSILAWCFLALLLCASSSLLLHINNSQNEETIRVVYWHK